MLQVGADRQLISLPSVGLVIDDTSGYLTGNHGCLFWDAGWWANRVLPAMRADSSIESRRANACSSTTTLPRFQRAVH